MPPDLLPLKERISDLVTTVAGVSNESAGALTRNSSGDPVQGRTGSSDQSVGPTFGRTGRTAPWYPATATGPGGGSRLLRRRRIPGERGETRASIDGGRWRQYRGPQPASVDSRRRNRWSGCRKGSGTHRSPRPGRGARRHACRSRVSQELGTVLHATIPFEASSPTHPDGSSSAVMLD